MTGRLIGVVGPSGVGKDTVMDAIAKAEPRIKLVRRVITRAPELGGEDYDAVTVPDFEAMVANGAFCLHWGAHGLFYGIRAEVRDQVQSGAVLLVNLSRRVLPEAEAAFPSFVALNLTAKPETLAARLAGRGRENEEEILRRLARADLALPQGVNAVNISNDGPLGATVTAALDALYPVRA